MQRELGRSASELTGAFSLALLVAGVAGVGVGRYLDRHGPRALMTAGSVAGALLVVAWSQVEGLGAFYAIWIGIGLVMAAVLYEPAFVVLAKWFPATDERRRAMTALTLVAGLSSFIFLPLAQALIDAHGWRDALLILAVDPRCRHDPAARAGAAAGAGRPPRRGAGAGGRRGRPLERGSGSSPPRSSSPRSPPSR